MVYMNGILELCSARPAQLYGAIMDTRLGKGTVGGADSREGQLYPGSSAVMRREDRANTFGAQEPSLGSLFASGPAGETALHMKNWGQRWWL